MENVARPWPALWALVIGFFMILVDTHHRLGGQPRDHAAASTPTSTRCIWVTSAYLLAYAVPLLITGRLGDRFGPKNLYLVGLVVFTAGLAVVRPLRRSSRCSSSRACVQGLGAALMTPQTMAVITRIFPPDRRGAAMGLWGAMAGVATLVGPILGGVLVDCARLGVDLLRQRARSASSAFILAWRLVPTLETHPHRSTSSAWCSAPSACSCWSSASRRARPTTGAPSSARSPSGA